ncbi:MAG: hypothetical protein AB7O97_10420 [Planctomycetota bacterium]
MNGARRAALPMLLTLVLPACTGLTYSLHEDVAAPHTLALLPVAGSAGAPTRELARGLLAARLRERGYVLAEPQWVDRALAERGWLDDPDRFDPAAVPVAQVAAELGVDGVLVTEGFDETRWNALVLRRHALAARLRVLLRGGREWWSAEHVVGGTGGFLLQSGQVLTELRALGMHGTSAATIALVDDLLHDVAATLPVDADRADHRGPMAPPQLAELRVQAVAGAPDGEQRLQVSARASAAASVWCDLVPGLQAVPMTGSGERFTAAVDVPSGAALQAAVAVRARGAFGDELRREVAR